MDDLQQLYIKSGSPSKTKFITLTRKLRAEGKLLATPDQVKEFLDASTVSVFDDVKSTNDQYKYDAYDYVLIADLMSMENIKAQNRQYNWILCILEFKSRFLWTFPLKNKSSNDRELTAKDSNPIAAAFASVLEQIDPDRTASILIITDLGGEFKGQVSKLLNDEDYPWVFRRYAEPKVRKSTQPIERVIRTLRDAIKRINATNDNLNWIDHIQGIVARYNSDVHTGIDDVPVERLLSIKNDYENGISHAIIDLDSLPKRKFPDGTIVRLKLPQDTFAKRSFVPKLSTERYRVVGFEHTKYQLVNINDPNDKKEAIESHLRVTNEKTAPQVTFSKQLNDEQRHNTTQRRLAKEVLNKKSIDNEVVIDEDGRERVQIKKRRLPLREKRDKTAANARIAAQFKGKK